MSTHFFAAPDCLEMLQFWGASRCLANHIARIVGELSDDALVPLPCLDMPDLMPSA